MQHQYDATPWEVEAARRREVVRADFEDSSRARRRRFGVRAGVSNGIVDRLAGWFTAAARNLTGTAGHEVDDANACRPVVGAMKPGR
jgi:hypothetical protein